MRRPGLSADVTACRPAWLHGWHAHAADHLDELIAEFHHEPNHGLRCWLLELIGHARSPRALPLLTEQLHSTDEALRHWAVTGLELLNTHEARQTLYQARAHGQIA